MRDRTTSIVSRLRRADGGNVSVILAFALVPLFGFVGLSIDYGEAVRVRTKLKASTDAAALAGVSAMLAETDAAAVATSYMTMSLAQTGIPATFTVTPDVANSSIAVTASYNLPNKFMSLLGYVTTNIQTRSKAESFCL